MSGIGSIGSQLSVSSYLLTKSSGVSRPQLSEEQQAQFAAMREQQLDEALTAAGVDEETADAIKADLKTAFEESISSSGGQLDPEAIKEQVDGIFAKYGLDASEFLGKQDGIGQRPVGPPPGGPPPGSPPPSDEETDSSSTDSSNTDSNQYQSLLDIIQNLAEQESDPKSLAELVVDALYGLDKTA